MVSQTEKHRRLALIFPGQGTQKKGMGGSLFAEYPEVVKQADKILGYSIQKICLENPNGELNQTLYTQPAIYTVNALTYFAFRELNHETIHFALGHSLGEYNALLAAEVFDFETGLKLVKTRAELMTVAGIGTMAAVIGLDRKTIQSIINRHKLDAVYIANENTYAQNVISGDEKQIKMVEAFLMEAGAKHFIPLKVSGAFHSPYMGSASQKFREYLEGISVFEPKLTVIANTSAAPYEFSSIKDELANQIVSPVRWKDSVETILDAGTVQVVELGEGKILSEMIRQIKTVRQQYQVKNGEKEQSFGNNESEIAISCDSKNSFHTSSLTESHKKTAALEKPNKFGKGDPVRVQSDPAIQATQKRIMDDQAHINQIPALPYGKEKRKISKRSGSTELKNIECILDILRFRAANQAEEIAYTYLNQSEGKEEIINYGKLEEKVNAVATHLQNRGKPGQCVLLLYPSGIEFIIAFLACLKAKMIAVPASIPNDYRKLDRLTTIVEDSSIHHFLTISQVHSEIAKQVKNNPHFSHVDLISSDTVPVKKAAAYQQQPIASNEIAFLQYTSGSTGAPKGVMVSHRNILANSEAIQKALGYSQQSLSVTWLPNYHDMGLIDGVIQPLFTGFPCVMLSPESFLKRPLRWLQAITKYQATHSGGPNFGYQLCCRSIKTSERKQLDLSSWKTAYNGAEPIRKSTLEQFTDSFKPCGFKSRAFYPCYGMAESTLIISGGHVGRKPVFCALDSKSLEKNEVKEVMQKEKQAKLLVGCGQSRLDTRIVIVNPDTKKLAPPDQIGEIWVAGSSVTQGYWKNSKETEEIFNAYLKDTGEGPFLRTGDLGFMKNKELFVTGRLKDVIIIRGRNHYPQDIELGIECCHTAIRAGCGAAFSIEAESGEELVVVQEIKSEQVEKSDLSKIVKNIREIVLDRHGLNIYAIALIKPGTVSKTSSGKIQRRSMQEAFLNDTLDIAYQWRKSIFVEKDIEESDRQNTNSTSQSETTTKSTIRQFQSILKKEIALLLDVPGEEIAVKAPFNSYGINSADAVRIIGKLEEILNSQLSPTLIYDYPSIADLTEYLSQQRILSDKLLNSPSFDDKEVVFESLESTAENKADRDNDPIAVIGMGCRFPGASSPDEYWDLLKKGKWMIRKVEKSRWNDQNIDFNGDLSDETFQKTQWGGFIDQVRQFDARLFGISPVEAESMDPQQRLLLEVSWEALENAALNPLSLAGKNGGVYIGISNFDYSRLQLLSDQATGKYCGTGNAFSIAANRISYTLDLRGPSLAIDTACSSSLVAVHHACKSLLDGECDFALAGGVNLILTPHLSQVFSQAQMLAPDGRCKTFDEQANGYVRGEGCGVVVLKRLKDAQKDGDPIHALIMGTAINQDGKSNGITAPNGPAQGDVLQKTIEKAGVQANQIGYIEAHGTGTSLGDPIEMNTLIDFLSNDRTPQTICHVSSVKPNIGHLESASGIAGLIKTIFIVKEGTIPPHLHFEKLNPLISNEQEAVNIPLQLTPWPSKTPHRYAGVSSFGFGGTNAHAIVSNPHTPLPSSIKKEKRSQLVLLSSKTAKQLHVYAERLRQFVEKQVLGEDSSDCWISLENIAYTSQVGRPHMDVRLAIIADSVEDLLDRLARYLRLEKGLIGVFEGIVENRQSREILKEQSQINLEETAKRWVLGISTSWSSLYDRLPKRVAIPTYPFEQKPYWLENGSQKNTRVSKLKAKSSVTDGSPDPNSTSLREVKCGKLLTGKEFYLAEHHVNHKKVMPAAALLETVFESGCLALDEPIRKIADVQWLQALVVDDDPIEIETLLQPTQNQVSFQIASNWMKPGEKVYTHGIIITEGLSENTEEPFDIEAVKDRCTKILKIDECYSLFNQHGLQYGQTFQVIQTLYTNENEALSKIELPTDIDLNNQISPLHPSIIDGAFQTVLGLLQDQLQPSAVYLPSYLGCLERYAPLSPVCYAYVQPVQQPSGTAFDTHYFDILIVNKSGRILLQLDRFGLKQSFGFGKQRQEANTNQSHTLVLKEKWIEKEKVSSTESSNQGVILVFDTDHGLQKAIATKASQKGLNEQMIVLVKPGKTFKCLNNDVFELNPSDPSAYDKLMESLQEMNMNPDTMIHHWSRDPFSSDKKTLDSQRQQGLLSVYLLCKAIVKVDDLRKHSLLYLYQDNEITPSYGSVSAFLKSIQQENPGFGFKTMALIESQNSPEYTAGRISAELPILRNDDHQICFKQNQRYIKTFHEIAFADEKKTIAPLFEDGAFIITGAFGGLGLHFAQYLAQHKNVTLFLVSRTATDDSKKQIITSLEKRGATIQAIQADISNPNQVRSLITRIKSHSQKLDGIIHCAGITNHRVLPDKDKEEFIQVLAPKWEGLVHIDHATQNEPLRFFVMFSSITAIFGNAGQSDYAAANSFMNHFSEWRSYLVSENKRSGKTISICWPYWENGGMKMETFKQEENEERFGLSPLSTDQGTALFEAALRSTHTVPILLHGNTRKIRQSLLQSSFKPSDKQQHIFQLSEDNKHWLQQEIRQHLTRLFSEEMKLPVDKIESHTNFSDYGVDSLMVMEITRKLEERFGRLPKTLFFEYQSIDELSEYFVIHHAQQLLEKEEDKTTSESEALPSSNQIKHPVPKRTTLSDFPLNNPNKNKGDIAIVGVSGRYPLARNLDEFWENLRTGRDCITEIPENRWDHRLYFDKEKGKPGKMYCKWGGFLEDMDKFDPQFFSITPREAAIMDPQERLFLETSWETIENAGYTRDRLSDSKVGVFVGVMWGHYELFGIEEFANDNMISPRSSFASIANRISYSFNFNGPSIAVDTMCSSSLTAICMACASIERGESELAIAGGVNLSLHPSKYIQLSEGRFSASDGRCRSFGVGGDGYVPGEGVGALLLKPLDKAVRDRDHIHGVIKGWSMNHGGKTNGYTVPSPVAQAELLNTAIDKAGIDASTINYLETHGTGTALGDPIEINGLMRSYGRFYKDTKPCVIGSVKSNIGHLESAAGIAGVTKVLLQLKHKTLVPSLHSQQLNPNIEFDSIPFRVQQQISAWKPVTREDRSKQIEYPRRSGVSAFGAGGSNAHLIIEEYSPVNRLTESTAIEPQIVVLSARNDNRLKEYAKQLIRFIVKQQEKQKASPLSPVLRLENLAYTLQTGREVWEKRLAVITESFDELKSKLERFCDGEKGIEMLYLSPNEEERTLSRLLEEKEGRELFRCLTKKRDLEKVAQIWAAGIPTEWDDLYSNLRPRIIEGPTYPFARDSYWIPTKKPKSTNRSIAKIHPLIDQNISTLKEEKFATRFVGDEFYLIDHVIDGQKILPGAVYLEMFLAAVKMAAETNPVLLSDITWVRPLVGIKKPKAVETVLSPDEVSLHCEVRSENNLGNPEIYCSGTVFLADSKLTSPKILDLAATKIRCFKKISAHDCYESFKQIGFEYGPSFQTIKEIWHNDQEALALLELSEPSNERFNDFGLHPSLLDGAFQAIIVLLDFSNTETIYIPATLKRLHLKGKLSKQVYAYVTSSFEKQNTRAPEMQFNIQITDRSGKTLAYLYEFNIKKISAEYLRAMVPDVDTNKTDSTLYFKKSWDEVPMLNESNHLQPIRCILLFDSENNLADQIRQQKSSTGKDEIRVIQVKPGDRFQYLESDTYLANPSKSEDYVTLFTHLKELEESPDLIIHSGMIKPGDDSLDGYTQQLENSLYSLFHITKVLIQQKSSQQVRLISIAPSRGDYPITATTKGFLKSVCRENPFFLVKLIEMDVADREELFASENWQKEWMQWDKSLSEIRYQADKRYVKKLEEFTPSFDGTSQIPIQDQGVYLITGGAGELGLIFAEYLTKKTKGHIVLVGRSKLTVSQKERIESLRSSGVDIIYQYFDISDRDQVLTLVKTVKDKFGEINGVLHSAGIKRDQLFINKSLEEFKTVLQPKIFGTLYLDQALEKEPLDFFILFSSLAAETGNIGQVDYAAANSFLDAFAQHRGKLESLGRRSGKTISIGWPLWNSGGMQTDEDGKSWLKQSIGLTSIQNEEGIAAFENGLLMDLPHFIFIKGQKKKIEALLSSQESKSQSIKPDNKGIDHDQIKVEVIRVLTDTFAQQTQIDPAQIDPTRPFDSYGIDSVIIMNMSRKLEERAGELPSTLLFEFPNIADLAEYFVQNHSDAFLPPSLPETKTAWEGTSQNRTESRFDMKSIKKRFISSEKKSNTSPPKKEVAIVGLSGQYPQAKDINALWDNLKAGKDCISLIPEDRWDYQAYFDPEKGKPGKMYNIWGGFMDNVDQFDSLFFNISPREAELMDPQERLFMETVWHVLEDAGHTAESLSTIETGVFVGVMWGHYQLYAAENSTTHEGRSASSSFASIANRVSHYFDFKGPSLAVDTMCSSSLVAINLACNSILNNECDLAIAGGVNLSIHQNKYLQLCETGFASTDGRCRSFGSGGDGYVPGEGVGAILLKPLERAIADKDQIYGVIKGWSMNHGGRTNGYTMPNPRSQGEVIKKAFQKSGIDPQSISYVEAHGTGTSLGDPIEIAGLSRSFQQESNFQQSCAIGSIKSNIGHLEAAAGIAGLTKVLLQIKHKQLVPSLHSDSLNPNIRFQETPFYVQQALSSWERPVIKTNGTSIEHLRRAGISAFGAGGSNAHLIVEEFANPDSKLQLEMSEGLLFILSAKSRAGLNKYVKSMIGFLKGLENHPSKISLVDIAYTLQIGRSEMDMRLAVIARSQKELINHYQSFLEKAIDDVEEGTIFFNGMNGNLPLHKNSDVIESSLKDRDLKAMARLWTDGNNIPWQKLYENMQVYRRSLPTYPFDRKRHWAFKRKMEVKPIDHKDRIDLSLSRELESDHLSPEMIPQDNTPMDIEKMVMDSVCQSLKLQPQEIDPDRDLGDYGFDSITALKMMNNLRKTYGEQFDNDLLNQRTVNEILNHIKDLSLTAANKGNAIIPQKIESEEYVDESHQSKRILINGTTGVLGSRLVYDFLKQTDCRLSCMVRAKNEQQGKKRIQEFLSVYDSTGEYQSEFESRVRIVPADITQPNLGLSPAVYQQLTEQIDLVIHCAGKVSLHGLYQDIKPVNIDGTANMIDFTLQTKQKKFAFISSYTVMGDRQFKECRPFSERDLDLGQSFEKLGYPLSKYEGEKMVHQAAAKGLKWIILRPGNIMGDSQTGQYPLGITKIPSAFYDMIKTMIEMQLAVNSNAYFDITPVDYCSHAIIYLSRQQKSVYKSFHLTNPEQNTFNQLVDHLNDLNFYVRSVDRPQYLEALESESNRYASLTTELVKFNPVMLPAEEGSYPEADYTKKVLAGAGIHCPPADSKLLKTLIGYCQRIGYLKDSQAKNFSANQSTPSKTGLTDSQSLAAKGIVHLNTEYL